MLLTTLVLLIVGSLAGHTSTGRTLSMGRALLWGLALVAGGASFGSGLGVAIAFPIAAWLVLPRARRQRPTLAVLVFAGRPCSRSTRWPVPTRPISTPASGS